MNENMYFDNSASTRIYSEGFRKMCPYIYEQFANPSAVYHDSVQVRNEIQNARIKIADTINAHKDEIYFTSGGTESDNWALIGIARALYQKGRHIITSKIEHSAVLETCRYLESIGFSVTYLDVDSCGRVDPVQLADNIRKDTILVSIMTANNEVGTIQPVRDLAHIAHQHGVLFHTDAVQAYGHIPVNASNDEFDLLSASSHKFHGPKGVGFLYIKNGTPIKPLIFGGSQEKSMRSGTENTAAIVGMGYAAEKSCAEMDMSAAILKKRKDYLQKRIINEIEDVILTGDPERRLPNHFSCCIKDVNGTILIDQLSRCGISAATGSACHSRETIIPSHVLQAMAIPDEFIRGALRLTLCEANTEQDIDACVNELTRIVSELREWN